MAAKHIVFLYGTLKSGQSNFRVLSDPKTGLARFLAFGQTVKRYPLVVTPQHSFPFLLPVEGKGEYVQGEVYEVSESKLQRLDEFEGHPDFYLREKVAVAVTSATITAWSIYQKPYTVGSISSHSLNQ
ncbi:unnamed protein product [Candidula unifasciata]|uniref:Gamma-glutamylcyclotransferase family protein n=1 Tax=Candidula unifasciata TaxID=100452 RepID=A0A8S3YP12_9EUPU|nr:unnamed protein product [Candidula unifasciata]